MKILAFSDVYCDAEAAAALVAATADADLVIGAGDFGHHRNGLAGIMELLEPFADKAIYVAGNNETPEELRAATSARVLHGEMVEWRGVRIFGIGGAIPELNITAFESFDIGEADAAPLLAQGDCVDIMVSHSPPKGVADMMAGRGSIGAVAVRDAIDHMQPKLVFCGHIHDCWGQRGKIGQSEVINLGPSINWFEMET